ncbi:endonuclease [Ichthyenterobacterium sp. W332]|uniref:Endonuclease n=1 Tax=Microcosmobacter mediterraneus TaxID=3075607 RepID=A0ABU2YFS6_9FLAO|nr:endonuclease [Ichthyenterobacterium sp. W332]MDT0557033.1 endonuclease [Ichthyenterobacterium sp. W332]
MKLHLILCFFCFSLVSFSQILVINEIDVDTPGIDDKEFIELKSESPNFALDGYILVFFNGSSSGDDRSYMTIDLAGSVTDSNGLLLIGSANVIPFPQFLISENVIQNGADAIGIYEASIFDFPEETLATQTNLIDALVYDTSDSDDVALMNLLGVTEQINEGSSNNTNSIQRNNDGTYFSGTPSPRQLNDGSGIIFNGVTIGITENQYNEGESLNITFTTNTNVTSDLNFTINLDNNGFNTTDYTGNISLTIPSGTNTTSTILSLTDDSDDEGDEVLIIKLLDLVEPIIPSNNNIAVRVVDNDFTMAPWGKPITPTFGLVQSTQPGGYYDSLDGLADSELRQALQDIIADPNTVRAQTYNDVTDILKAADQNPENSNEVWLVYTEQGRPKLDFQTTSDNSGKWNREHTYPRSRGGFFNIEEDDVVDGPDIFWTTKADSLRHGNSDAHALRAADGAENSLRGNQHYGEYTGPSGTLGSFRGDVARSVLYMEIRYNGLEVVNGFPSTNNEPLGDLATLLDWHRNDPPDDFEMNRNNVVYTWQLNRNPFIDQPDLVEYIWGTNVGQQWVQPLSVVDNSLNNVQIFPNPIENTITINGLTQDTQITIFSLQGLKVYQSNVNNNTPFTVDLFSGLYLLQLNVNDKISTRKIIIK